MKFVKKLIVAILCISIAVSMTGCTVLFDIMSNDSIDIPESTKEQDITTEETPTEETPTEENTQPEESQTTGEGGLVFTQHSYNNIRTYAHDGVSAMELAGVRKILNKIITPEMTEVERIKAVHDWLVKNTTYVDDYYELDTSRSFIYNLIYRKTAVCQGYAVTFYVMMTELGIPCTIISGYAEEPHAWNAVELEGCWYYVDVTWDDPIMSDTMHNTYEDASNISYAYLLCSYDYISKTHTADDYQPTRPTPEGVFNVYNDHVYKLAGYGGVYRMNDYDDAKAVGKDITTTGKYVIFVDDYLDVEKVIDEVYMEIYLSSDLLETAQVYASYSEDYIKLDIQ